MIAYRSFELDITVYCPQSQTHSALQSHRYKNRACPKSPCLFPFLTQHSLGSSTFGFSLFLEIAEDCSSKVRQSAEAALAPSRSFRALGDTVILAHPSPSTQARLLHRFKQRETFPTDMQCLRADRDCN